MSFLHPIILGQFQKFGKTWVGALSSPFTLGVRFDLPSSINFSDIDGFPKLEARGPY